MFTPGLHESLLYFIVSIILCSEPNNNQSRSEQNVNQENDQEHK